jgi:hypothetical protein
MNDANYRFWIEDLTFWSKRMINSLITSVLGGLSKVTDNRAHNRSTDLHNTLKLSFAMFHLKMPSLLQFRKSYSIKAENLRRIYGVKELPGDVAIRGSVDQVNPAQLKECFTDQLDFLRSQGVWEKRRVLNGRFTALSSDGTQHYCSNSKGCPQCLVKNHRNGKNTYYHQMLATVAVHPDKQTVFPVSCEAIVNGDGSVKNDCEMNALKRLLPQVRQAFGEEEPILQLLDALYHNGPCIRALQASNMQFIIGAKGDHYVGVQVKRLRDHGQLKKQTWEEKDRICIVDYAENLLLNGSHPDINVNYFSLTEVDKKSGEQRFYSDWITDVELHGLDMQQLTAVARSRWKVENETFNTLKNQGYNLEHSYGHGTENLTTNFALLMLLAFLIDQIAMALDQVYQKAKKTCGSFKFFWERIRQVFDMAPAKSMEAIYRFIALNRPLDIPPLE